MRFLIESRSDNVENGHKETQEFVLSLSDIELECTPRLSLFSETVCSCRPLNLGLGLLSLRLGTVFSGLHDSFARDHLCWMLYMV